MPNYMWYLLMYIAGYMTRYWIDLNILGLDTPELDGKIYRYNNSGKLSVVKVR